MTAYGAAVVLSMLAGGSPASVTPPAQIPQVIDYDFAFAKAFPVSGREHRIADWSLYVALVTGDLVSYGEKVDPSIAERADAANGKPYQTQQLELTIKGDTRLVAAFNDQRRRIQAMVVYVDGEGFENQKCQHALSYVENEFRLVLGEGNDGADPLSHATIAPSCPSALSHGFQITAGRSTRFKCWPTEYTTRCGWALPDMPAALKSVVENEYPASMGVRWRWRGLGGVLRTRYVDAERNRVALRDRVSVTVPGELGLEFIDAGGHVVWTASATMPAGKAGHVSASRRR